MELMIVIAIIGIMTSIILIYPSKADKEVEGAAREIAAMIRESQNNALTGKLLLDNESLKLKTPCSFSIRFFNKDANDLEIVSTADLKNESTDCSIDRIYDQLPVSKILKNIKYNDNYASWPCEDGIVRYVVPFGNIEWCRPAGTDSAKIKIWSARDEGAIYTVCVYKSGKVEEKKGDQSC